MKCNEAQWTVKRGQLELQDGLEPQCQSLDSVCCERISAYWALRILSEQLYMRGTKVQADLGQCWCRVHEAGIRYDQVAQAEAVEFVEKGQRTLGAGVHEVPAVVGGVGQGPGGDGQAIGREVLHLRGRTTARVRNKGLGFSEVLHLRKSPHLGLEIRV